jgi:hypothetical protein
MFTKVVDSGKRQEFNTGSVRDTAEGKGMPHLIGGEALAMSVLHRGFESEKLTDLFYHLCKYNHLYTEGEESWTPLYNLIDLTLNYIISVDCEGIAGALNRLAIHYENGAKKYSKNNWRKGQPVSRYYDSAFRHMCKEIDGCKDEDHAAALLWNLIGMLQTKNDVRVGLLSETLDDFPFKAVEVFNEK